MRKYYIDNVRILCVLLLFPFHSAYIYNNLDEVFYVNGAPSEALTAVDLCISVVDDRIVCSGRLVSILCASEAFHAGVSGGAR